MALRDEVTKAMCKPGSVKESFDEKHPFHHKNYEDNLYCPLSGNALEAYKEGSGNETKVYWRKGKRCPPKMASIASSSAMTFNLLGNEPATIQTGEDLPGGTYEVQYEKQMYTLKTGKIPANLDAFLSNDSDKTAIFCEMKMLEWLNKPGVLRSSYQEENAWFVADNDAVSCPVDAYKVFEELREKLQRKTLDATMPGRCLSTCWRSITTRPSPHKRRLMGSVVPIPWQGNINVSFWQMW